jgi:hypothetical protein
MDFWTRHSHGRPEMTIRLLAIGADRHLAGKRRVAAGLRYQMNPRRSSAVFVMGMG